MARQHRGPRERGPRRGRDRRSAAHPGREWLYGRQPVRECLLANRRTVHELHLSDTVKQTPELDEIVDRARAAQVAVRTVDALRLLDRVEGGNHQGVALQVDPYPYVDLDAASLKPEGERSSELVLLLDHVQDPQNVGAILRSADAAGVRDVMLPVDRACGVTPAVVRASAGACEHLRIAMVTNLVRTMKTLKDLGYWVVGVEGSDDARLYTDADLTGPTALVVGSEGRGMGRLVGETCDFRVHLPMRGHVNSLNVNAATAIALYEVRRQQGAASPAG